jgi:type VI protein secretion system component VasK
MGLLLQFGPCTGPLLEQQIQKNIDNPTFVYEALKVYLMLGGKAPSVDKNLILAWFARDWEERTIPGAPYAEGRRFCARISRRCSIWTQAARERSR